MNIKKKGEITMKQRMFITILAVFAVLAGTGVKVFAREAQPADDRGRSIHRFSSHFMIKNGLQLIDDRGSSTRGSDDLPGDDRGGLQLGDDRGLSGRGADDLPGDDRGLFGHGADDLPGDDKGGATPTTIVPVSPTQPADDRGGSGHGSDDLPGDDKGGDSQISSSSSLGLI